MRRAAAALLVAVVLAHGQFALACAQTASIAQHMPCCPTSGEQAPGGCAGADVCLFSCAVTIHFACHRPVKTVVASGLDLDSGQGVHLLAPVWPEHPGAAHQKPPSQGPPAALLEVLTGRYTYLATLRLRI